MSRFQHVAAKLLLPVCALCLLGPGFSRAQDAGSTPPSVGADVASSVNIEVDGQVLAVRVAGGDVAEALQVAGVELGEEDECSPAPGEAVEPNMTITVHRVETRTVVQQEPIRARSRVVPNRSLRAGITYIKQHPQDGLKELTYRVTFRDGKVASRELLGANVLQPVKDKLIHVGGGATRLPSRGGYFTGRRVMKMVATGYPAMVCGTGRTYLGLKATRGIVAVDPRIIPLGARVHVEGYGEALAADIGSAIKGNRIDLCFPTFREANRYGKKSVTVRILTP
jgi:3D (Asp-Asp-Asp) domain-containing protein